MALISGRPMTTEQPRGRPRPGLLIVAMVALCVAFLVRVLAQFVQAIAAVGFLPEFESWQSGALPYPLLFGGQLLILVIQVGVIRAVVAGTLSLDRVACTAIGALGAIYFVFMLFRLVAGFTFLAGHSWFDAPLPSSFHLVLASFVILVAVAGLYRTGEGEVTRLLDWSTYPLVVLGAIALLLAGAAAGIPVTVAGYGPVALAAVAVMVLENRRPHRPEWRPDRRSIVNDTVFLVLVQMLLPLVASAAAVFALAAGSRDLELSVQSLWPHSWPVAAQILAMVALADLFRYWLHRAFHTWQTLWRFHAVHHSPQRLYWLNVGRFHPLEKGGQLLFDSLPFVLVGVGDEVLAGYFVFYAVNGFLQHSNCRVSLGWLNYVISGPELHRWHHSRIPAESDTNYGNNLIIWDLLFGTRFLPRDRNVEELGLINRRYPVGFAQQMAAPFHPGLDKAATP